MEKGLLLKKAKKYLPLGQRKQLSLLRLWCWQKNPIENAREASTLSRCGLTHAVIVITVTLECTLEGKMLTRVSHRKGRRA